MPKEVIIRHHSSTSFSVLPVLKLAHSIQTMLFAKREGDDIMLNIGITRRLDHLGRIVIPKELRNTYKLVERDMIEVIGTEEGILLRLPQIEISRKQSKEKENGND